MSFHVPDSLKNSLRLTCAALLAGGDKDFRTLRQLTEATDGNLSVQLSYLEQAGLVEIEKGYLGKRPRTVYHLTSFGRTALTEYTDMLWRAIHASEESDASGSTKEE